MIFKIIGLNFIILLSFCCWGIDNKKQASKFKEELLMRLQKANSYEEQYEIRLILQLEKDIAGINDILKEISQKKFKLENIKLRPKRISEQMISGQDWFVYSPHTLVLKADRHIVAPSRSWPRWNCEIMVNEILEQQVTLTIVPETFPILGDHTIPDATWKAIVWLEEYPEKNTPEITHIPSIKWDELHEELNTCERNLTQELHKLQQQLKFKLGHY